MLLCKQEKLADTILTLEVLSKARTKWRLLLLLTCKIEMDYRRNKNLKMIVVTHSVYWNVTQKGGERVHQSMKIKIVANIFQWNSIWK